MEKYLTSTYNAEQFMTCHAFAEPYRWFSIAHKSFIDHRQVAI